MLWQGLIEKYRQYLPVSEGTPVVTLNEGNTLLLRARRLEQKLDLKVEIYLKYEGQNPTGSFKDRGMTLAVTKAAEEGSKAVICASTGNTSASAAAFAARAGLECFVIIPDNAVALGKLAQALIYGAKVLALQGNFDDALEMVRAIAAKHPVTVVNSINPYRLQGQKTGAFELCDQMGDAPDYLAIPVGNAGNISAYWMGFKEYRQAGKSVKLPRMLGFQAAGAAPIVKGERVKEPETVATAIRIGNPASWDKAVNALTESKGEIRAVSDEEILAAYRLVAASEGIFCEPASAASIAGIIKLGKEGYFRHGGKVVCILTGHGLKDPDIAVQMSAPPIKVRPAEEEIIAALGL